MNGLKFDLFKQYKVVVFDLDNTLYDEKKYLFSVYKEIGKYVSKKTKGCAEKYSDFLINEFNMCGRSKLFNKFLIYFDLTEIIYLEDLLNILRNHVVPLFMFNKVNELINFLIDNDIGIYILTNGNIEQQKNKIKNLHIQIKFPNIKIVYANAYEPKPSPYCLNKIRLECCVDCNAILMIGDSNVDFLAAQKANIDFYNIQNIL